MKYIVLISSLLIITISFLLLKDISLNNSLPTNIEKKEEEELKKFKKGYAFMITSLTESEMEEYNVEFFMGKGRVATEKDLQQIGFSSNLVDNKDYKNKTLYFYKVFLEVEQLKIFKNHEKVYSIFPLIFNNEISAE